jgi:hypothetical protein
MEAWSGGEPKNFEEIFDFYQQYVKLLYSEIQTQNKLPNEILFEINAAFDHLATFWIYKEPEEKVASQVFSHLKRSCLDIFKLKVKEARKQYDELCNLDTSIIDNGNYSKNMRHLFNEIRKGATEARRLERETDSDNLVPAFERWETVFINCIRFQAEFYLNDNVDWAKRKGVKVFISENVLAFILGIVAGIISSIAANLIWSHYLANLPLFH